MLVGSAMVFNRGIVVPPDLAATNDSNTKLLLHFNKSAWQANTFILDSAMGYASSHLFTCFGSVVLQASDKKFGATSAGFGGVNADYIQSNSVPTDLDFSGDWTVDFWANRTDGLTTQKGLCGIANNGLSDVTFWMDRESVAQNVRAIIMFTDGTNINLNAAVPSAMGAGWHHYALEKQGTTYRLYVDGTVIASSVNAKTPKTPAFKLGIGTYGEWVSNGNLNWGGYIDEWRFSNVARFKGGFTPPTKAYDVPFTNGNDAFTKLLLHFDGANGATSGPGYADSSLSNKGNLTNAGASQLVTALAKFGGTSWQNAQNGYGTMPNHADWNFGANDFTIDWWEYRTAAGAVVSRDLPSTYQAFLVLNPGAGNTFYASSNGSSWDVSNALPMNNNPGSQWFHQAVVRRGNRIMAFLNGELYGTTLSALALITNGNALCLGAYANANNMGGYTDEFRISNVARWTDNFTPPTAAYGAGGGATGTALPANSFVVTAVPSATQNVAFTLNIQALDINGVATDNYGGTIHFTSTDPAAVLPADTTLPGGHGSFPITLKTLGNFTIAVADTLGIVAGTSGSVYVGGTGSVTLTTGTLWTVPTNFNKAKNRVECYGGGGAGKDGTTTGSESQPWLGGPGGGGGAYARIDNIQLTPGQTVNFALGQGGTPNSAQKDGGDTWFSNTSTVLAKGGKAEGLGGGQASESVGSLKFSGGNGGQVQQQGDGTQIGGAGGGCGGPDGDGGDGSGAGTRGGLSGVGGDAGQNGGNFGGGGGGGSSGPNMTPTQGGLGMPGAIRIIWGQ